MLVVVLAVVLAVVTPITMAVVIPIVGRRLLGLVLGRLTVSGRGGMAPRWRAGGERASSGL